MANNTTSTFQDLMDGFGIVTVMNARIYELKETDAQGKPIAYFGREAALKPEHFNDTGLYLDTLKIANMTQEGPTKTVTGGQYANPLIKYGKTMTMEMQDALGRAEVLERFFGCHYDRTNGILSVDDQFAGAFAIEGDSFFIHQKTGHKVNVHIFIPQFQPDSILSLTQDAEGDATVFDLNGSVNVTKINDGTEGSVDRSVFYQIRDKSFFASASDDNTENTEDPENSDT